MSMELRKKASVKGEITVPGDKSISHRGVMFGAISEGITELNGFLDGADCRSTVECFRRMGIQIEQEKDHVTIHGKGLFGLSGGRYGAAKEPIPLDVGNSGTTTRLISGILAGQSFSSLLSGDDSLNTRPMKRIMEPLTQMGASIRSVKDNGCAPLLIQSSRLHAVSYSSPVASAQVKSCVLLAGLYAEGQTCVTEPALSRNHTELMLRGFGAKVKSERIIPKEEGKDKSPDSRILYRAAVTGRPSLYGQKITVPGDISSAAFFIAAGLISENSDLTIKNVNINPTRAGILAVCDAMGAKVERLNPRTVSGEEVADLHIVSSPLHGTVIEGEMIPTLIDEIPVIAVMAAFADGETVIRDAAELKVKESDRIMTVTENLRTMGAQIRPTGDGMVIQGGRPLHGALIKTYLDHRIAMAFAVASTAAEGVTILDHPECVSISYPDFYRTLNSI